MRRFTRLSLLILAGVILHAGTNPVPLINNPLAPDSAAPGSAGFKLTVNGAGFVPASTVTWNGAAHATTFVSDTRLTITVLASDVAVAGTASVTVVNPAPGGGRSGVAYFEVTQPALTPAFATAASALLPNAQSVSTIVAADLNGDGNLDLVVGTSAYNGIHVLLGNGNGTFQPPATYDLPYYSYSAAIGDFNRDGKLDIAVAEWAGEDPVAILLGNGDGTFQPYQSYPAYQYPYQIAVGDFNGDGSLDLATVTPASGDLGYISVLAGNGDGTFQPYSTYTLSVESFGLLTGDFNGDGRLDLAAIGATGISILLGNGDGTFQNPVVLAGSYDALANGLAAADFNGDGILDLAAVGASGISIFLGKGDGTFMSPVRYPGSEAPLAIGDFDGDGKLDIAQVYSASNFDGLSSISILRGNGDGTFQAPLMSAPQIAAPALAPGDFYGAGRLDLVSSSYTLSPANSSIVVNAPTTASVTPAVLAYSPTLQGKTRGPETVTVTNNGAAPLNITQVSLSGPNAAGFALVTDTCQGATVPAGGTCAIGVSFSPPLPGPQTAFLNIADDAAGSPQMAGLAGDGTVLSATPEQLNFGSIAVGATSANQVVRITNTSAAKVALSSIAIDGADKGDFYQYNTCGRSLNPKASCSVVVQFIPTRKGSRTANLAVKQSSVTDADPPVVPLSGTGT